MSEAPPVLLGIDPGSRRMGYCIGDGRGLPFASAWRFDQCGDDLGEMAVLILRDLRNLVSRERPAVIAYEAPILRPTDRLGPLRKTYSLGTLIELVGKERAVRVEEVDIRAVKRELAGFATAEKPEMVAASEKIGMGLPLTKADGREDAADAFGVWLLLLRSRSPKLSAQFDAKLWGSRGGLPF